MPQQPDNTHADDVYNRALIKLFRAAIAAAERAEALEAKSATEQEDAPTDAGNGQAKSRTKEQAA